jgi:DNA-binding CsgD family transcriptional regulator
LRRKDLIGKTPVQVGFINEKTRMSLAEQIKKKGLAQNIAVKIKIKNNHVRFMLFNTKRVRLNRHYVYLSVGTDLSDFDFAKKAEQLDIVFHSLNSIRKTGVIIILGRHGKKPSLFYINQEAKNVLKEYPFKTLLRLLSKKETAYIRTDAGFYQVKEIPTDVQSPLKFILMERVPDATCMKEKLGELNLTSRQKEIAILAANGHSNREIAEKLCLSEYTIKDHLKVIFQVISVSKRSELCPKVLNLI